MSAQPQSSGGLRVSASGGLQVPASVLQAINTQPISHPHHLRVTQVNAFAMNLPWTDLVEILAWCAENTPQANIKLHLEDVGLIRAQWHIGCRIEFDDDVEAVAFKLRWEGK